MTASLEEIAYKQLRGQLLRGELTPGQSLSEAALARQIGVSRTPVRHALRQLEKDGLVVQVPRMGTFVKAPDAREVEEAFHLREVLECECAAMASGKITEASAQEMRRWCEQYRAAAVEICNQDDKAGREVLITELVRADLGLHALILRTAGSRMIARLVSDLRIQTRTRMYDLHERLPWEQTKKKYGLILREHAGICEAICAGQPAPASDAMRVHVRGARQNYLEQARQIGAAEETPLLKPSVRMLLARSEAEMWSEASDLDALAAPGVS